MKRSLLVSALALLLVAGTLCGPSRAEEEDGREPRLVTQLFDVSALTRGVTDFIPNVLGTIDVDMVSDEERPLFGAEGEEPILPYGTIDEIVELVKTTVQPVFWEVTEGADIRSRGEGSLVVRATPEILAEIAVRLAGFEMRALATVEVDVVAVPGATALPGTGAGPLTTEQAAALLRQAKGPSLMMSGLLNQRMSAWSGRQISYVQDYDVEVAQSSSVGDPIVGVMNLGLAASSRATLIGEGPRLQIVVQAWMATPTGSRVHDTGGDHRIDLPQYRATRIRFDQVVMPGQWYVAPGGGGPLTADGVVMIRTRVRRPKMSPARIDPLPSWPTPDASPLEVRIIPVMDLNVAPWNEVGQELNLVPSNFTPPEPPELAEPTPLFPTDALVDLLQEISPSRAWNRTGSYLEVRNGQLYVIQTAPMLHAMEATIEALRQRVLWTLVMDVDLIELPAALALRLGETSRSEAGGGVGARALKAVEAALKSGDATRIARAKVTSMTGARSAVLSGRRHHYVQDYEVEIAEAANIPNPVVQILTEGLVADLHPSLTAAGDAVTIGMRISTAHLTGPIAQTASPHGPIDVPEVEVLRFRGDVYVPLGQTALVGAGGTEKKVRLLLITPSLERAGR